MSVKSLTPLLSFRSPCLLSWQSHLPVPLLYLTRPRWRILAGHPVQSSPRISATALRLYLLSHVWPLNTTRYLSRASWPRESQTPSSRPTLNYTNRFPLWRLPPYIIALSLNHDTMHQLQFTLSLLKLRNLGTCARRQSPAPLNPPSLSRPRSSISTLRHSTQTIRLIQIQAKRRPKSLLMAGFRGLSVRQ